MKKIEILYNTKQSPFEEIRTMMWMFTSCISHFTYKKYKRTLPLKFCFLEFRLLKIKKIKIKHNKYSRVLITFNYKIWVKSDDVPQLVGSK